VLTAEDVVRRIAAKCACVDERGGSGIRMEPAAAIMRQYGEQFRRAPRQKGSVTLADRTITLLEMASGAGRRVRPLLDGCSCYTSPPCRTAPRCRFPAFAKAAMELRGSTSFAPARHRLPVTRLQLVHQTRRHRRPQIRTAAALAADQNTSGSVRRTHRPPFTIARNDELAP
jgi:hypothetical protein